MPRLTEAARAAVKQQRAQQQAKAKTVPAPVGGLNARDSLAAMPETDAIILDNWFPRPTWVEIRGGESTLATFTGNGESVMAYNSLSGTNQLYAGVNNAGTASVYRVDNAGGGSAGSAVVGGAGGTITTLTNARFDWTQFGTGAVEALVLVNGSDDPVLFDGSTWYDLRTSGTYQLTGGPGGGLKLLNVVCRYKSRLWFLEANSMRVWYLPQNVFAGALTQLNMGANFTNGGNLVAIVTNSVDNSQGINDYIAFVSNQGEVVMFQGFDPSQSATFFEAGHFTIGRPLAVGRRTWCKIGSDAAVLTADGLVPLSQALVSDRSQQSIAITDKIRDLVRQDVALYGALWGWQVVLYPEGTKIVVNVPTATDSASHQYAQNTLHGAWCTFGFYNSAWNALCFERGMGGNLYAGQVGQVSQVDTTPIMDGASAILATAKPAFSFMDEPEELKVFTQAQPFFQTTGKVQASININVDFDQTAPTSTVQISNGNSSPWGSLWTTPTFWGDASQIAKPWIGMSAIGLCASMQMRISASNLQAKWMATKYMYIPGGEFYGR